MAKKNSIIWESNSPSFAYSYLGNGGITTLSACPCFFKGKRHILLTAQDSTDCETRLSSCPVEPKDLNSWSNLWLRGAHETQCTRQIDGRTLIHLHFVDMYKAEDLADRIRRSHGWAECSDILPDFCDLAGMRADYEAAGADDFERVLFEAADFLGVDLLTDEEEEG